MRVCLDDYVSIDTRKANWGAAGWGAAARRVCLPPSVWELCVKQGWDETRNEESKSGVVKGCVNREGLSSV